MQYKNQGEAKALIERLSDYFTPKEFACPCCWLYLMDDELIMALENLRDVFGHAIAIASGYRCEKENAKVHGVKNSMHLVGKAVDIKIVGMGGDKLGELIRHIHTDYTDKGVRRFGGFGMGNYKLHIDVRIEPTAWTY